MQEMDENLDELITCRMLDPAVSRFVSEGNGYLSLYIGEECHKQVNLIRLLPFNSPDAYISCVADEKEIGIIRNIADFSEEQQKILRDQLFFRYYVPEIEQILSLKEKMWFLFIRAVVNGEKRELCLNDLYNNIKYCNQTDLILTDVEENHYLVRNFKSLPRKIRQKLEIYL